MVTEMISGRSIVSGWVIRENFNARCYSSYYSITTLLK
jgi:hypothetical protein